MRILVIGSGGREHALVWKISKSPLVEKVLAAPGSAGMEAQATCFPEVGVSDEAKILALCRAEGVDLVVIGPEDPLAQGLSDTLREAGLSVFGPSAKAAQLEASKRFAGALPRLRSARSGERLRAPARWALRRQSRWARRGQRRIRLRGSERNTIGAGGLAGDHGRSALR